VRAKVVSGKFNGKSDREKQAMVWEALQAELGSDADAVSYVITYGTDEL
jgi:stress-induced morphogen